MAAVARDLLYSKDLGRSLDIFERFTVRRLSGIYRVYASVCVSASYLSCELTVTGSRRFYHPGKFSPPCVLHLPPSAGSTKPHSGPNFWPQA